MSTQKEMRQIIREINREGFSVHRTPGGHYAVMTPEGKKVYALPSTPGRGRAFQNLRAALRREGVLRPTQSK